jgi:hypothetical protein
LKKLNVSKKKKFLLFSIFSLILSVILLIPNTKWTDLTSVGGFICVALATMGSIVSLFIPNSYTHYFTDENWKTSNDSDYFIIISSKTHGLGNSPHIQVFKKNNSVYEEVVVGVKHDDKGTISICANSIFTGKIIVT